MPCLRIDPGAGSRRSGAAVARGFARGGDAGAVERRLATVDRIEHLPRRIRDGGSRSASKTGTRDCEWRVGSSGASLAATLPSILGSVVAILDLEILLRQLAEQLDRPEPSRRMPSPSPERASPVLLANRGTRRETGLPDTGLADDRHGLSMPVPRWLDCADQIAKLGLPAHEARRGRAQRPESDRGSARRPRAEGHRPPRSTP